VKEEIIVVDGRKFLMVIDIYTKEFIPFSIKIKVLFKAINGILYGLFLHK
jgi:hypothetical protein